jgi:hypothetical protein
LFDLFNTVTDREGNLSAGLSGMAGNPYNESTNGQGSKPGFAIKLTAFQIATFV